MSFVHPGWLILAAILPFILIGAIFVHRGRSNAWKKLVATRLEKKLVKQGSNTFRWISLAFALLACACLITTIARPYYGETKITDQISSRNVIIAIDTSRSMLVRDGSPDRITAAKAMSIELVKSFPNDRIGIIAFSGRPILMAPLTVDHGAVLETISQLDSNIIPSGGSDLAAAAQLAIETFKKTGQDANALIIISDGEDHSVETGMAANSIREAGIRVCAIGVGSAEGGVIPDYRRRDGKFRDYQGNTVVSKMIPDALQQISDTGKGTYLPASKGADRVIKSALQSLDSEQQEGEQATIPNERYYWFLIPAVALILLSMLARTHFSWRKKPALAAIGILAISLGQSETAHASPHLEQGTISFQKKDYETALSTFSKALPELKGKARHGVEFAMGNSAFKLSQWKTAIRYFSKSLISENKQLQEESHYNLANSLFKLGWHTLHPPTEEKQDNSQAQTPEDTLASSTEGTPQPDKGKVITIWEDAITHYQAALTLSPDHADAAHNLKEVEKLLKDLKEEKQQEEQEQQEQEQQDQENQENQENQEQEQNQDGEQEDQENEGEDGEDQKEDDEGEENEENQDGESDNQQNSEQQQQQQEQQGEQKEGETEEEFAARILEEEADLQTRPIIKRLRDPRRREKDW